MNEVFLKQPESKNEVIDDLLIQLDLLRENIILVRDTEKDEQFVKTLLTEGQGFLRGFFEHFCYKRKLL